MTAPPPTPDKPVQWTYSLVGKSHGPATTDQLRDLLASRKISPEVPVWHPGMSEWAPARTVPELVDGLNLPAMALMSPEERKAAQIVKNAKVNAIAMFLVFLSGLAVLGDAIVAAVAGKYIGPRVQDSALLIAGLFAAIYVPLRWRTLRQLPAGFRLLGLIGGLGLIGLLVLGVLGLALRALAG